MRRLLKLQLLAMITLAWMSNVALAAPGGSCVSDDGAASITCGGDLPASPVGSGSGAVSTGSSSAPSNKVYRPVDTPSTGPNGEPCTATNYIEVPPGAPELPANNGRDTGNVLTNPPPCPAAPGAPALTPAQVAARYWEEVPLPSPQPAIAPGWAISGKLAYLETNGELSHTYYNETPLGRLQIVATGTYEVDWGDDTGTQTYDTEGAPWPDGQITHDYQWAGTYNIVVTEHWTATWHLGGQSGNLRRLRTEGGIDNFEVRQIQAVRYR